MKVYVDADACPVKDIIIEECEKRNLQVFLVSSIAHFSHKTYPANVQTVYVEHEREAADYRIMQLARKGDIIVTQDYGLASLLLPKGCIVVHHKGFQYTNKNIDTMLQSRYISQQERKAGKRTKGPKAFTKENKEKFREKFSYILEKKISKVD